MADKKNLRTKLLACFSDLQRAATSFYLNPQGQTHQVFLNHGQKILTEIKKPFSKRILSKVKTLKRKTALLPKSKKEIINLADEVLTLGLLLKGKGDKL